jgi:hypothetical protein
MGIPVADDDEDDDDDDDEDEDDAELVFLLSQPEQAGTNTVG